MPDTGSLYDGFDMLRQMVSVILENHELGCGSRDWWEMQKTKVVH